MAENTNNNNNSTAEICGILPVAKPAGWTSFDVIAKLRGVLKIKRLGHSGTLDPMATGVLPVFVGRATKACDIIPDRRKVYTAGFEFGKETDTLDSTGTLLKTSDKAVSFDDIMSAKGHFIGDIMQVPPMYSAIKVGGKKLYELARAGKEIEREPRPVHIDSIDILEYDENMRRGIMKVDCQKGTYIRSVIADIGEKLGCGGIMTSLERSYSGGVDIADCFTLEQIIENCAKGSLEAMIMPVDKAFECYEKTTLGEWETKLYKNGVKLRPEQSGIAEPKEDGLYRVYGSSGDFLGIGWFKEGCFKSFKNF